MGRQASVRICLNSLATGSWQAASAASLTGIGPSWRAGAGFTQAPGGGARLRWLRRCPRKQRRAQTISAARRIGRLPASLGTQAAAVCENPATPPPSSETQQPRLGPCPPVSPPRSGCPSWPLGGTVHVPRGSGRISEPPEQAGCAWQPYAFHDGKHPGREPVRLPSIRLDLEAAPHSATQQAATGRMAAFWV